MSMPAIRNYLKSHPEERDEILNYNPSRVFFRIGSGGPYGSIGVPLTAGRSLATDPKVFPKGTIAYIKTHKPLLNPDGDIHSWHQMSRFVLNQDTGGAIRGADRGDLFWGKTKCIIQ